MHAVSVSCQVVYFLDMLNGNILRYIPVLYLIRSKVIVSLDFLKYCTVFRGCLQRIVLGITSVRIFIGIFNIIGIGITN